VEDRDDDYGRHAPHQVVHHHYHSEKSPGIAAILEVLPGLFFQTFGIGHMYAGQIGTGLLAMFGYWVVLMINIVLCYLCIGMITLPICWVLMMVISPIKAAQSCGRR
jgi:TM2 domain-containing membrane protein YozV